MTNNTSSPETTAAEDSKQESLGVPTMYNVTNQLLEKAIDKLTHQELEWLTGFSAVAKMELANVEDILEDVGCLIANDEISGNFESKESVSTLLFSFSNQLNSINAMLHIAEKAREALKYPQLYRVSTEEGAA
jgi:hypothetical protein